METIVALHVMVGRLIKETLKAAETGEDLLPIISKAGKLFNELDDDRFEKTIYDKMVEESNVIKALLCCLSLTNIKIAIDAIERTVNMTDIDGMDFIGGLFRLQDEHKAYLEKLRKTIDEEEEINATIH